MTVEIDVFNVYYSSPKKPFTLTELPVGIRDINKFVTAVLKDLPEKQKWVEEGIKKDLKVIEELKQKESIEDLKIAEKENKTENMNRLVEEVLEKQTLDKLENSRTKLHTMHKSIKRDKERQEQQVFKDWDSNNTGGILGSERVILNLKGDDIVMQGKKENENKVDYSEIDWHFIEGLAKRMNKNKEKYEPFNYHKPMNVELLKQSLLRHTIEIMKGNYDDAGQEFGHLYAVALNSQMIYYQLKNYK
jgi:hypothetical protein